MAGGVASCSPVVECDDLDGWYGWCTVYAYVYCVCVCSCGSQLQVGWDPVHPPTAKKHVLVDMEES